ncbi:MAG: D-alanyl-D-alanine carboxypeptidase [Deltaproteobacteria bacterium]|nr:D-alanyl-D-alanine carboxypeptidase [Deltaproteobacteria bacterium]
MAWNKRWFLVFLALVLLCNATHATQASQKHARAEKRAPQAQTEKEEPCKAYIVVEGATGKALEGENVDMKWPPASMTKLMLAAVVLEKVRSGDVHLSDKITVSSEASKMGGSQVFLKEGEVFSLEELMKATLVASGNDAAYAVAEFVAGSVDAFVRLMNERARALNMVHTEFHSVHGLPPSEGQREDMSSCRDLALLARSLLRYPELLSWTSTPTEGFRGGTFVMTNHNKLLSRMPSVVDGLKTGYYRKAGYNVTVTAQKEGLRLIVVVMGSPTARTRDRLAEEKLKKTFSQYAMVSVTKKGDLIEQEISLPDGKQKTLKGIAGAAFACPVPQAKRKAIQKEILLPEKIEGEVKQGQKLGEMLIRLDKEVVGKIDIVSPEHVPEAGLFTRMMRKLGLD